MKAGFLHRDISEGNILIVQVGGEDADGDDKSNEWEGYLTDWELSKPLKKRDEARQLDRTVS